MLPSWHDIIQGFTEANVLQQMAGVGLEQQSAALQIKSSRLIPRWEAGHACNIMSTAVNGVFFCQLLQRAVAQNCRYHGWTVKVAILDCIWGTILYALTGLVLQRLRPRLQEWL